jgi:hypothetical protein
MAYMPYANWDIEVEQFDVSLTLTRKVYLRGAKARV